MLNEDWARWITSSIEQHFITNLSGLYTYLEGMERFTEGRLEWVEVRVDGPDFKEIVSGQWYGRLEINLAIVMTLNPRDGQKMTRLIGQVQKSFTKSIAVHKYGDQDQDDQSYLGCLQLLVGEHESIRTSKSGIVEPRTPITQATVEAHYDIYLEN